MSDGLISPAVRGRVIIDVIENGQGGLAILCNDGYEVQVQAVDAAGNVVPVRFKRVFAGKRVTADVVRFKRG